MLKTRGHGPLGPMATSVIFMESFGKTSTKDKRKLLE